MRMESTDWVQCFTIFLEGNRNCCYHVDYLDGSLSCEVLSTETLVLAVDTPNV